MKIVEVNIKESESSTSTLDTTVGDGYLQGVGGQLADVDIDFQSDRRGEVKAYLEQRYNTNGKQRVFSAGTLTTLKIKAALKDVARVHRVPLSIANYISGILSEDKMTWGDMFRLAAKTPRLRKFINDYPQVIEDMRGVMGQPRSASVHASAILITPDTKDGRSMECFDYTPIKRVDDLLVSE
ncbi:MAG: DNA polymerase III subunit alpha, partial [Rikenellaceae bacterium]